MRGEGRTNYIAGENGTGPGFRRRIPIGQPSRTSDVVGSFARSE